MHAPLALMILGGSALASEAPAREMRGVWVVRTSLTSQQAVDRVVDRAAEGGVNTLFVQVRGRGDAFYESRLVPRSVLLERQPAAFDPLARLIERARARGLQVHTWVNVLLTAHFGQPLPGVIVEHPDWIMIPRSVAGSALTLQPKALPWLVLRAGRSDGDVEGYYLSPFAPGVAEHLEGVLRELVRGYPVDGLHLDFVRYPGPEYDYSRAALEGFRKWRGGSGDLLAGPAANAAAWDEYRRDSLTALVDRLVRAARYERPGVVVSAAVVPDDALAVSHKYQGWPAWMSRRILDAVCPMAYTQDTRLFRQQVERARSLIGPGQEVWAGVAAYRLPLDGVVEKVRTAREAGAAGVLLFSHESVAPGDWRRLRDGAFPPVMTMGGAGAGLEHGRANRH